MKVRTQVTFDMDIEDWHSGWEKLKMVCERIEETGIKGVGRIYSMGFE